MSLVTFSLPNNEDRSFKKNPETGRHEGSEVFASQSQKRACTLRSKVPFALIR